MLPSHLALSRERRKSREHSQSHSRSRNTKDHSKSKAKHKKGSSRTVSQNSREFVSKEYGYKSYSNDSISKKNSRMSREKILNGYSSHDMTTLRSHSTEKMSSGHGSIERTGFTDIDDYFIEERLRIKEEMDTKSIKLSIFWMLFWSAFLGSTLILHERYGRMYDLDEITFADLLPSVTHYKLAILSNDFKTSHNIKTVLMNVGSNINYAREAAVYYTYKFKNAMFKNKTIVHPFSLQTSLLAWNFEFVPSAFSMQPVLVHHQTITESGHGGEAENWANGFDMGKSMMFSKLPKTSMFSETIDMRTANEAAWEYAYYGNNRTLDIGLYPIMDMYNYNKTIDNYTYSEALPLVSLDSLYSMTTRDLGTLRIASSGPKTLGIIAEIAIRFALKALNGDKVHTFEEVDNIIAESLACSLQALERYPGYFENLTLNIIELHKDVKNRTDNFRQNLNCLDKKQSVKVNTNGVSTSNVLFMYHSDGWPTVIHYSVSTNGTVHLESSNGKKSAGLLNVCQIVVMKEGNLWLTAAASGEFYLLEKVISSIVHKIVKRTDPLKLLNRDDRQRYDVGKAEIVTGKYPPQKGFDKEVLQFSEYNILHNRFRSWVETSKGNSEEEKMNVASGY